jgi:hypothetical protein
MEEIADISEFNRISVKNFVKEAYLVKLDISKQPQDLVKLTVSLVLLALLLGIVNYFRPFLSKRIGSSVIQVKMTSEKLAYEDTSRSNMSKQSMIEQIPDISEFNRMPVKAFVEDSSLVKLIIRGTNSHNTRQREYWFKEDFSERAIFEGNFVFRDSTQSPHSFVDNLEQAATNHPGEVAVIVSYKDLKKYQEYFPHHHIHYYESVGSFWDFNGLSLDSNGSGSSREPRKDYKMIYEFSNDNDIWNIEKQCTGGGKEIIIDVIINAVIESVEDNILGTLAASRWQHYKHFEPDRWKKDELRDENYNLRERNRYETPKESPRIYIPAFPSGDRSPVVLYRLPSVGPEENDLKKAAFTAGKVREVVHDLQNNFNGCGWFSGNPEICIVADQKRPDEEIEIVESGKEHEYVLSCSPSLLLKWIEDGSIDSGRVLLHQSRRNPQRYFTHEVKSFYKDVEIFSRLDDAEVIVCWCNNASSNSPSDAKYFLQKFKEMNLTKRIQVKVLYSGINGFESYMSEMGLPEKYTIPSHIHYERMDEKKRAAETYA